MWSPRYCSSGRQPSAKTGSRCAHYVVPTFLMNASLSSVVTMGLCPHRGRHVSDIRFSQLFMFLFMWSRLHLYSSVSVCVWFE
jgi:hypothetical protein